MKKLLHSSTLLLLSWCLSLAGMQQAWASHAQAGQLSYQYVSTASNGNQTYTVRVDFFRDCSGIPAPTSFTLNAQNSCSGTSITTTLTSLGAPVVGTPYCASVQALAVCPAGSSAPGNAPPNFSTTTFQGTIVLPPAAEWILSVEESARPSVTNLSSAGTLRLEARLNSLITPVGGGAPIVVHNNSPVFSTLNLPVPFVYVNQEATISFSAVDTDLTNGKADSLVYSLDRPLNGCGTFETYAVYPTTGCQAGVDPLCSSRLLSCVGIAGSNYSATLPIAVSNDTLRPTACNPALITNGTIRPKFVFTASQASFRFTPNRYVNSPSATGDNKYAVVGKVTEYRKINGVYYLVGTARRDFLVIVIQGAGNTVPSNPTGTAGPPRSGVVLNITRDTTDLEIKTCNYSRVRFNFTDPDNTAATPPSPLQNLTVFYPNDINTVLLQGGDIGTFSIFRNGTPTPSGTFYFQPTSALAGTTVLITLRIEDDGCPAKGIQYRTIRIRIVNFAGAEAVPSASSPGLGGSTLAAPSICPGGSIQLNGTVNRPDSIRVATTGLVGLQTYSYQWTAQTLAGAPTTNGLPAVTNVQNITVNPTASTRYLLRIEPLQGFGVGACGDVKSLVVNVAPEPVATITLADPLTSRVCGGGQVTLQGRVTRPQDQLTDSYTYRWTGPGVAANATTQNLTITAPVAPGLYTYQLVAQGQNPYGCDATATVQVQVVPPPVVAIARTLTQVCAGGAVLLTATTTPPSGAGGPLADTYTYVWSGPGVPANSTGATLTVRPTAPGINVYTVAATGTARYGCSATQTVPVEVVPPPVASIAPSLRQVCAGAPVLLTATTVRPGGTGSALPDTYTYQWSGPGVPANATGSTLTVTPTALGPNTYTVTATGTAQFNCSTTTTVSVQVVPPPTVVATTDNAFACPGGQATLTAVATPPNGFADTYTYTWTGGSLPANTTGASISVRPTTTTTYTVTATGNAQSACANTATVTVQANPTLTASFTTADSLGTNGQRTQRPPVRFTFNAPTLSTGQAPTASYTYQWTYQRVRDIAGVGATGTETTFSTSRVPAPVELNASGSYIVRLRVTPSINGTACPASAVAQRTIIVPDIQVPNVITPNNDGLNDVFKVSTAGTSSKIEIYNRWGRKVYEQTNYQNNWGGDNEPAGVYYYLLTTANGAQVKGWIEIMR